MSIMLLPKDLGALPFPGNVGSELSACERITDSIDSKGPTTKLNPMEILGH